ncbi:hypothetical protein QM565_30485 [Geitlerinema splendidum]|nr:hypothetical protein [Geitlerinema splendidum]
MNFADFLIHKLRSVMPAVAEISESASVEEVEYNNWISKHSNQPLSHDRSLQLMQDLPCLPVDSAKVVFYCYLIDAIEKPDFDWEFLAEYLPPFLRSKTEIHKIFSNQERLAISCCLSYIICRGNQPFLLNDYLSLLERLL